MWTDKSAHVQVKQECLGWWTVWIANNQHVTIILVAQSGRQVRKHTPTPNSVWYLHHRLTYWNFNLATGTWNSLVTIRWSCGPSGLLLTWMAWIPTCPTPGQGREGAFQASRGGLGNIFRKLIRWPNPIHPGTVQTSGRSPVCQSKHLPYPSCYLNSERWPPDSLQWTVSDSWSLKDRISLWEQRHSFSHSELHVAHLLKWGSIENASDMDFRRR